MENRKIAEIQAPTAAQIPQCQLLMFAPAANKQKERRLPFNHLIFVET
jgi:hypothetical protein